MKIVTLFIVSALCVVIVLGAVIARAKASCSPESDPTLFGGTYDGPGSLGGVLGTGVSAKEIQSARLQGLGGTRVKAGAYSATAYAPAAGGINCGAGCTSTASGIRVDSGTRRAYLIASNPQLNQYGAFAYIWPNPYGWRGPFVVADTGGAFNVAGRLDFYIFEPGSQQKALAWGMKAVQVSAEPIVPQQYARASEPHIANATYFQADSSTADTTMVRPTSGPYTSPFGERWGRLHAGLDIAPPAGTPILAALAGRVVFKGVMDGYGNFTCIRHAPRLTTCYGHQQAFASSLHEGDLVARGQTIGYVGNTGNSTGPHLHFEVRLGPDFSGTPVDPMPFLKGAQAVSGVPANPNQCATGAVATLPGQYAWPIGGGDRGQIIGRPGEGTHSFSEPPNNWQSDEAIDIGVPEGTPILAVDDGVISKQLGFGKLTSDNSSRFAGYRLHLVDAHANTWYYAHLSQVIVRPGQSVTRGELLGYSGSANGVAHLHIAVKDGDPLQLLGVTQ